MSVSVGVALIVVLVVLWFLVRSVRKLGEVSDEILTGKRKDLEPVWFRPLPVVANEYGCALEVGVYAGQIAGTSIDSVEKGGVLRVRMLNEKRTIIMAEAADAIFAGDTVYC